MFSCIYYTNNCLIISDLDLAVGIARYNKSISFICTADIAVHTGSTDRKNIYKNLSFTHLGELIKRRTKTLLSRTIRRKCDMSSLTLC